MRHDNGFIPHDQISEVTVGQPTVFVIARRGADLTSWVEYDLLSSVILDFPDYQMVFLSRPAAEVYLRKYFPNPMYVFFDEPNPVILELNLEQLQRYLLTLAPWVPGVLVMERHDPKHYGV